MQALFITAERYSLYELIFFETSRKIHIITWCNYHHLDNLAGNRKGDQEQQG